MAVMDRDDMKWRTLKSNYIIRRPWLTARRDTVELPSGAVNDEYYVLEYPDWVNVIAITTGGRFVMIRQYRHGIGQTCHETGYGGGEWRKLMAIAPNASTSTNFTHCFVATGVEPVGNQHLDPTEDIDVLLAGREEVLAMLRSGELKQATMAAPLWRYFAENP